MGYHTKKVENSQRQDERLLAELAALEDVRENSWGWDEDDEADFQEITRSPRIIKTLGRIARRNMIGRIVRVFRPVLRIFSASSAEAASRHRESDDAGGGDDGDDDPARTRYLQRSRVLSLLLEGEALTQPKALEYKIWRLAARIAELGKRGWRIQKRRLPGNFCEYTIDPNNPYSIDPQSTLPFEGSADR